MNVPAETPLTGTNLKKISIIMIEKNTDTMIKIRLPNKFLLFVFILIPQTKRRKS